MSCREFIEGAARYQEVNVEFKGVPIRVFPSCHPNAHWQVDVDPDKGIIHLSCGKCDKPMGRIKCKIRKNTNESGPDKGPKNKA
jgi:hypothetical protein